MNGIALELIVSDIKPFWVLNLASERLTLYELSLVLRPEIRYTKLTEFDVDDQLGM